MRRTRGRRRRSPWRTGRRAARTLVLVAVGAAAAAAVAPAAWVEAKRMIAPPLAALEAALAPAADRVARGAGAVRAALGQGATGATVAGPARVVDGDTLSVGGARVRLHGIDAPERGQRCRAGGARWDCGRDATRALEARIGSGSVACEARDRDRYGRTVAVCRVAGADLNAWMVAQGWAFAYRKYARDYVGEEAAARAAKRGVWRGEAVAPWDWRRGARLAGEGTAAQPGAGRCAIKGNVGKGGTRIYHVPGGQHYEATRIDTAKGERWFCTEAEARAAGWRRSRR